MRSPPNALAAFARFALTAGSFFALLLFQPLLPLVEEPGQIGMAGILVERSREHANRGFM